MAILVIGWIFIVPWKFQKMSLERYFEGKGKHDLLTYKLEEAVIDTLLPIIPTNCKPIFVEDYSVKMLYLGHDHTVSLLLSREIVNETFKAVTVRFTELNHT